VTRRAQRLDPVDDEAGDDRGDREQQEKARAEQAELARAETELVHDRHRGDADHRLVGEVDHHEQKQEGDHQPGLARPDRQPRRVERRSPGNWARSESQQ
jgi:hypothetical protein